jgi:hypothetical protein
MKIMANQKLYKNELILSALESLSARQLAARCKVSQWTIAAAKKGENLSIGTLRALAEGIGIPICELVGCEKPIITERRR